MTRRQAIYLLPGVLAAMWLNITVLLFAFGPWPWPVNNALMLYLFLASAHCMFFLGYLFAIYRPRSQSFGFYTMSLMRKVFVASLLLNGLLLFPTSQARAGVWIPIPSLSLLAFGDAYNEAVQRRAEGGVLVDYVRIILGPVLVQLLPLTVYFWRDLGKLIRLVALMVLIGFVLIYVTSGTNKAVADIIFLVPLLVLARWATERYFPSPVELRRMLSVVIVSALLFFALFSLGQIQRTQDLQLAETSYFLKLKLYADRDWWPIYFLPEFGKTGVTSLIAYLTQGYYGLSLSLSLPFEPSFGTGHSIFLFRNAARLFEMPGLEEIPYPVRTIALGWEPYALWSSIYPWIASDVTFVGTVFIVGGIGFVFGKAWCDLLQTRNPFAATVFAQIALEVAYFSANNQVGQSGEGLIGFLGALLAWILTRNRK